MRWSIVFLVLLLACGDSSTPAAPELTADPFDGRAGTSEKYITLVSAGPEPEPVRGVLDQRRRSFAGGHYRLTIYSVPPPGAVLPFNPLKPRWLSEGHYWLEGCDGRACNVVFEQTGGYRFDVVTGDSVALGYFLDVVPVAWGEVGFRMGDVTYKWENNLVLAEH